VYLFVSGASKAQPIRDKENHMKNVDVATMPLSRSAACALARDAVKIVLHDVPAYGPRQWVVRSYDPLAGVSRAGTPGTYAACLVRQASNRITAAARAMGYAEEDADRYANRYLQAAPCGRWEDWTPGRPSTTTTKESAR
jgi:hypothetical protein